ncbi:MAG: UDP-N-acetylmuramate: L-alanyl-gamma-D-glutamyl-meso-diaminopimelate ligase, partial [Glaciecola sp.]
FLFNQNLENTALLLMSSGDYGGLNFEELKTMI